MEVAKREKWREDDCKEETEDELSPELPSLPPEIITEILLWLPAKSIGRFRCVSKLFHSLLSNPGFANSHLNLIFRNDVVRLDQRKLLVSSHNLYSVGFDSIANGCEGIRDLAAVELNYPLKDERSFFSEMIRKYVNDYLYCGVVEVGDEHPMMVNRDSKSYKRNWVEIVGSSNGLVCISPGEGAVFLYNPTTGESKRIPDLPESMRSKSIDDGEQFETFGFGFDDLTKDYKVVKLVANYNVLNGSVYSLKTNSWRQIADLPYEHSDGFYTSGVCFNGSIHWVVTLQEGQHQRLVTAFDLKTEEFREMPLPDEAEDCSHRFRNFVVGNLNGRLCVVNSCYEVHDDIWVMNEYGEPKSWSRIRISLLYRSMKPLCSTKNDGEFLLELDGDLILYNFKLDTSRTLEIHGVQLSDGFEAYTYVESLISPNSYSTV